MVTRTMAMEESLTFAEVNDKIVAHLCAYEGPTHTFLKDAWKIRRSRDAVIDPDITCNYPESINDFILEQIMNEIAKKDRGSQYLLSKTKVWIQTSALQPERFMMDLKKTRQVMHTIEMGYDLTTSQATILFVNGLNTELRKEMGRLRLISGNTIKRWTKIPAEESP